MKTNQGTTVSSHETQVADDQVPALHAGVSIAKNKLAPRELREAQHAARWILQSPDFFSQFLEAVKRQGLVGEEKAALVVLIVVVSRLLKRPLNLLVKGRSASGKNFLVRKVLSLVARDAVIEITSTSEKAWYYLKRSLSHCVVLVQERNKASGPVESVRTLISEGKLIRLVPTKVNGEWVTKKYVFNGPIASISTTTKDRLEIDDETRHISLWVDESAEQTNRIVHSYGYDCALSVFEIAWLGVGSVRDGPKMRRIVDVEGTGSPCRDKCHCKVMGPASSPSAVSLSRSTTIAAMTSSGTARGLLAGRRDRGSTASKHACRSRSISR